MAILSGSNLIQDVNENLGRIELSYNGESVVFYPDDYSRSDIDLVDQSGVEGFISNFQTLPVGIPQVYKRRFSVTVNNRDYEVLQFLTKIKRLSDKTLETSYIPIIMRDYVQPDYLDFDINNWETSYSEYQVRIISVKSDTKTVYKRKLLDQGVTIELIEYQWNNIEQLLQFSVLISGSLGSMRFIPVGDYSKNKLKQNPQNSRDGYIDTASPIPLAIREPFKYNITMNGLYPISGTIGQAYQFLKNLYEDSEASISAGILNKKITVIDPKDNYNGRILDVNLDPNTPYAIDLIGTLNVLFLEQDWRNF